MSKDFDYIKNLCVEEYKELNSFISNCFKNEKISNTEYKLDLSKYLTGNSKQIRSCLIFLFAKALNVNIDEKIIKLASAVEIIHNSTLIHDDIIDNADLRRGNTPLHIKYGNKLAVLSGDFLLSIALSLLVELPQDIMKNFATCLQNLVNGEISQYFEKQKTPSINEYLKKTENKTASLFIASLKSLCNLTNTEYSQNIEIFAKHFGISFQIRDDLKNFIIDFEQKPYLNDIQHGIYTAPVIFAFGENLNLSEYSTDEIAQKSKSKEVKAKTQNLINTQLEQAIKTIDFLPNSEYKKAILALCNLLKK